MIEQHIRGFGINTVLRSVLICLAFVGAGFCSEDVKEICNWEGEYFPNIPFIQYEGPDSTNLLAFRYYNASEVIMGKRMKDWLRFSMAFWHSFRGDGADPFGSPTRKWPWEDDSIDDMEMAKRRLEAAFEFMTKMGIEFWCFHDRDIAPEGKTLAESNERLDVIADVAKKLQEKTGIKLLWGTAQLFKHPRYMNGAATSALFTQLLQKGCGRWQSYEGPHADVFAYAAGQVKKCMDITHRLQGKGFNFWGGREGYHTLRNTDIKLELDNLAKFMKMAVSYKKKIGFKGNLLIEPKPQEPTKHQYDFDAASTAHFLRKYGLEDDFKLVIECNHATLAGHSCEHELAFASQLGLLGSIDINTGDPQTGWDTDQFLTDITEATLIMRVMLKQGGIAPGGFNFDAKLRRESIDVEDLFYAHIGSMDALARGLRNAAHMIADGLVDREIEKRYESYKHGIGLFITNNAIGFEELSNYAIGQGDPTSSVTSGQAEKYEMILSREHYVEETHDHDVTLTKRLFKYRR